MFRKQDPKTTPTVWQLYVNFGPGGGGKTTIAVFENDDRGLQFIESFKMGGEIVLYERRHDNVNYYAMEFTAKQAIDSQFLDMTKMPNSGRDDVLYLLVLEEVKLNKQLVMVIPEEDQ